MNRFQQPVLFFSLFVFGICSLLSSEELDLVIKGEKVIDAVTVVRKDDLLGEEINHMHYSSKTIITKTYVNIPYHFLGSTTIYAPHETEIVFAHFKSNEPDVLLVLFSDGFVRTYKGYFSTFQDKYIFSIVDSTKIQSSNPYPYYQKIVGDAIYVLEGINIYASWDSAKTWSIDTTGFKGAYTVDIAVDTNNFGWAATSNGIFYQHPDSAIWHPSDSVLSFSSAIFVDRKNRLIVSTGGDVLISTNGGKNWVTTMETFLGIPTSFGDDKTGNIYTVINGNAYRLSNLTPPWVNITDSLRQLLGENAPDGFINSIQGDSVLYAATQFGLYESTNAGDTWKRSEDQLPAFQFYGLVRSGNYYFVTTNLGMYRAKTGDSAFTKIFPANGYQGDLKLKTDSAGNIYTVLSVKINDVNSRNINLKSTDNGTTWIADTSGLGSNFYLGYYGIGSLYEVDAQGNQYTFVNGGGLFSKSPGGAWKLDTNGMNLNYNNVTSISTNNKKGIVYAVREPSFLKFVLYKKALNGTTWEEVDVTAVGQSTVRIISDNNGDIVLKRYDGKIFRYNGTTWTEIPTPTITGGFLLSDQFIVDKNGVLWVSFINAISYFPHSLQFTDDNGATWKKVDMDGVGVSFFATAGDSVFAVSWIDGIFAFTTSSVVSVKDKQPTIVDSYELYQNYPNPFNPTTTISFSIFNVGTYENASAFKGTSFQTSLRVYDILGREVATLVNEEMKAGLHSVRFDASRLSTGMYIYTLRAGDFVSSKKLLLMK